MTCKNCGKELHDNSKFCKYCGTPVIIQEAEEANTIQDTSAIFGESSVSADINPDKSIPDSHVAMQNSGSPNPPNYKIPFIIAAIVAVLAIIGGILAYTSATNTANTKIIKLQDTIDNQDGVIDDYYEQMKSLRAEVEEYKTDSRYYQEIVDFLNSSKSANKSNNYYADTNICFVRKGSTEVVNTHISYGGTIYYSVESGSSVSCKWNGWTNGIDPISFTGKAEGTTLVHFTKDGTNDNFYILVVCIP